jgi:hypothetical protein
MKSRIQNLSESSFLHHELKATFKGTAVKVEFPLKRFSLEGTGTVFYSSPCPASTPSTGTSTLSYIRGLAILPAGKRENQQQLITQYLWSLPTVASEIGSVLLAVDKGCAKSFGQAADAGGLEGTRALAEMRQLGCGFAIPSGEWIRINEQTAELAHVEWVRGIESTRIPNKTASGWIEQRFVAPPKPYSLKSELERLAAPAPTAPEIQVTQKQTPATENQRPWEIPAIESRVTESNDSWSRVAFKITAQNNLNQSVNFNGSIDLEDEDGFVLASEPIVDLVTNARTTIAHTGSIFVKATQINKFKRATAKLTPVK